MEHPNPDDALDSTIASYMKIENDKYRLYLKENLEKYAIQTAEDLVA